MEKGISFLVISVLLFFFLAGQGCSGSSGANEEEGTAETAGSGEELDEMRTEKLIGTPFEGLTAGDDFEWQHFLCDEYRTETIDSFPINIFAAFFTLREEGFIEEAVEMANEGMGFEAYELTEEWSDQNRLIYKVDVIEGDDSGPLDAGGKINKVDFDFNGKTHAEKLVTDWSIEMRSDSVYATIVAHELGHATGLGHYLIDYENDTTSDLEENSLMESGSSLYNPALDDYNYMMSMQGQIYTDHLGSNEGGTLTNGNCGDDE